ncbi:MAG TPA: hypothetical protein VIR01_03540, partial [Pyrinomonadaceae bacterium]
FDVASADVRLNRHTAFLTFENAKLLLYLKIFHSLIQGYFANIAEAASPDVRYQADPHKSQGETE